MAKPLRLLLVGLLNVMLLLTPIIAQANSDEAGCLPIATESEQAAEQEYPHHSDHTSGRHIEGESSLVQGADMATCRAQGCLIDLSPLVPGAVTIPATMNVPSVWVPTNLSDLTGPFGLRRPPRA